MLKPRHAPSGLLVGSGEWCVVVVVVGWVVGLLTNDFPGGTENETNLTKVP
jgi:hypothetical protein